MARGVPRNHRGAGSPHAPRILVGVGNDCRDCLDGSAFALELKSPSGPHGGARLRSDRGDEDDRLCRQDVLDGSALVRDRTTVKDVLTVVLSFAIAAMPSVARAELFETGGVWNGLTWSGTFERAKDGSMRGNGRDITFADGRKLFLGSSGTGAPLDGQGGKDR